LQNISQQDILPPPDRNEIQTWLNRKEESEQVIKRSGGEGAEAAAKLELILEESEDETDTQVSIFTYLPFNLFFPNLHSIFSDPIFNVLDRQSKVL
jgi:hypothetical protein